MSDDELHPCRVQGCPWRGKAWQECPLHRADDADAWDRQHLLMSGVVARGHTRHRG